MNRIFFVASRKEVWATVLAALHQLMIGCQVSGFLGQPLSGSALTAICWQICLIGNALLGR